MCMFKPAQGEIWVSWQASPGARPPGLCVYSLGLTLELCPFCLYLSFSNLPISLVLADSLSSSLQNPGLYFGLRGCPSASPCPQLPCGPQLHLSHTPAKSLYQLPVWLAGPIRFKLLALFLISSLPSPILLTCQVSCSSPMEALSWPSWWALNVLTSPLPLCLALLHNSHPSSISLKPINVSRPSSSPVPRKPPGSFQPTLIPTACTI